VSDELDRLWVLHGLDEQVVVHQTALARFPEQKRGLEARVTAERARLEAWKARFAEAQRVRRQLEKDIEVAIVEERKFQSQLPAVKKNEEYTALLHEIAGAKSRRSDLETGVLERMDDEQKLEGERAALEQAVKAAEREKAERVGAIEGEEAAERAALGALEARREKQLEGLAPAVRTRYERIRASKGGLAVVPILKGSCGGCFRGQPPQVLQEARRRDRLLTCEGCGRLLVWPPDAR
jgi:predicted  nucleic acid-binding Zn-ribbon protein